MTVKVKPLVWTHGATFCGQDHSYADTELGTWSMTAYSGRGGRWAYTDLCGNDSEGDWPTRDECQAAVEATREASIRSELEPKRELFWDYDSRCVVFDSTMSFSNAYSWEGWDIRQEAVTDRGAYAIWREHLAKDEYSLYGTADGLYIQGGMTEAEAKAAAQADYEARIHAAIEAPAQKPVDSRPNNCRFRLADEGKPYPRSSCQACGKNILTGLGNSCKNAASRPDETATITPPDHLALVAAAYRDAAGILDDHGDSAATDALGVQLCCSGHDCGCRGADVGAYLQHLILQQTPTDAEAHLTALLRAEYERGVREAFRTLRETVSKKEAEERILALLTQEGR